MRQQDSEIAVLSGRRKLAIFSYRSQADQRARGCFRTLAGAGANTPPALPISMYLISSDWDI